MTPSEYAILAKALRELAAICDTIAGYNLPADTKHAMHRKAATVRETVEIVGEIERPASVDRGAMEVTRTVATARPVLGALAPRAYGTDRGCSEALTKSRGTARSAKRGAETARPSR